ncbi:MAG: 2-phosphosulfolactate phosphatase, partial [Planctomycetota bacterium]
MTPDDLVPDARVSCGWGLSGLEALSPHVDVLVVIDVLSFSTACAVAREAGATVVPHDPDRSVQPGPEVFVAGPRSRDRPSLSPASLRALPAGTRIVVPSPNGSRLLAAARRRGLAAQTGCLRDRSRVAAGLADVQRVGLVAAGERWADGTFRFALEDWLGVGALAAAFDGPHSIEATCARAAFEAVGDDLREALARTPSGRELVRRGFEEGA